MKFMYSAGDRREITGVKDCVVATTVIFSEAIALKQQQQQLREKKWVLRNGDYKCLTLTEAEVVFLSAEISLSFLLFCCSVCRLFTTSLTPFVALALSFFLSLLIYWKRCQWGIVSSGLGGKKRCSYRRRAVLIELSFLSELLGQLFFLKLATTFVLFCFVFLH